MRMRLHKCISAFLVGCVKDSSISKYNSCRLEHSVAVGMCAATHSRGIVHHNTTYHRTFYRRRVRTELSAIRSEMLIDLRPYDTRLESDGLSILGHRPLLPVLSGNNEHGVTDRLSRKTSSGCTKSHGKTIARSNLKEFLDFALICSTYNNLRHQPVKASIGAPRESS